MAGILSGLFHAPLTSIFLIAEITGGYNLMVPLMIVSSISFAITKRFESHAFDIKDLADKGEVFTDNRDKNMLNSIEVSKLITTDIKSIRESNSLEELIEVLKTTSQILIPVLDENEQLMGVIRLNEIRPIILSPFQVKHTSVKEIIRPPKEIILYDETADTMMDKFENSQTTLLPVLKEGKFIGFISKYHILEEYRKKLISMTIE